MGRLGGGGGHEERASGEAIRGKQLKTVERLTFNYKAEAKPGVALRNSRIWMRIEVCKCKRGDKGKV